MFLSSLLDSVTWYPILFDSPLNAVRAIAFWLSVLLFISYMVAAFSLKAEKKKQFFKVSFPFTIAYICLLCALFLLLTFIEDGVEKILFIPLFILLFSIAIGAVALSIKRSKKLLVFVGVWVGLAFITALVCIGIHFASGKALENNGLTSKDVSSAALYILGGISILLLLGLTLFFGRKEKKTFDSKAVTYAAICIAMSFALSYMRIVRLPQGGSITPASLLPLMLYAYMFGVRKGVFTGFTYGLLQAFQDPFLLHPAQFLLDYPIAFAWCGLAGIFSHNEKLARFPQVQFALGGILAGLGRFCMHFLSGTFAFGTFAPEGTPAALYSLVYQAGYVLPDLTIALIAGILLFSSKAFVKILQKNQ